MKTTFPFSDQLIIFVQSLIKTVMYKFLNIQTMDGLGYNGPLGASPPDWKDTQITSLHLYAVVLYLFVVILCLFMAILYPLAAVWLTFQ